MNLVIFDIDGTLTNTSQVDEICYIRALADAHDLHDTHTDWHDCEHISDSGLMQHLFQRRFNRTPHAHEVDALRARLVHLLTEQHKNDTAQFAEIAGAATMLENLATQTDWAIAVATGCWEASALLKLRAANIPLTQKPAGFSEDGPARESIVSAAIERAKRHYNRPHFDRIVSVGDGLWDVKTAVNLQLNFVGVGVGTRAETLQNNGAQHVIPDFQQHHHFFAALENAQIPAAKPSV